MKIKSVNIPENFLKKGLNDIRLDRLGDTVIIAGKNGSGKTRFLDIIFNCVNNENMIFTSKQFKNYQREISDYKDVIKNNPKSQSLETWKKKLSELKKKLEIDSFFKLDFRQEKHIAVRFVPNRLTLTSPKELTEERKDAYYSNTKNIVHIDKINEYVLTYIQREDDNYFYATHQKYENLPESAAYRESFNKLNELIIAFLGTEIRRIDNNCSIFDRPIEVANLSDGQKVLLQLCVLIHALGVTLDNLILILDEPENHLHPAAQIEFIRKVKEVLKNGQIWIATHSIHILSFLNTSDIWYMYDNKIKYAGKGPEEVLNGLLGGKEQVEQLHDFLGLPSIFAINQFAYECLFAPNAIITGSEDSQIKQISEIVEKLKDESGIIRLLDYGAGKGRLISSIMENSINQSELCNSLDYIAFDKNNFDKSVCEDAIARVYGNSQNRYFNDNTELLGHKNSSSFDIIVMCNVLHEISPNDWISIFKQGSLIDRLLKDNGYLLIIEDTAIPNGELPNDDGFFILGETEIKYLFNVPVEDSNFITQSYNDKKRLFAYLIQKKYLTNITEASIKEALILLRDKCKEEIKNLQKNTDFKSGKLLGLWSQQLANLVIYLDKRQDS
jgi:ABC-type multidrug transport system ATPase subunit